MTDVTLRCTCGKFSAVAHDVTPSAANRVTCACKFCQRYVEHLGCSDRVLDEWGGTEVIQLRPSSIKFVENPDQLACIHLTETGARRWYTKCCNTPIANTMSHAKLPFAGVFASTIDKESLGQPLDDVVGPIRARVNGQFGDQAQAIRGTRWDLAKMLMHFGPLIAKWWAQGAHKESPFFGEDGKPIVAPERVKLAPAQADSPS